MNTVALFGSFLLFSLFIDGEAYIHPSQKKCSSLVIRKARVRLRNRGRLAKVTCQAGYQLLGEKFVFCEEGRWADPLPSCIRGGCPSMKSLVTNAHFMESYFGALVEVTCDVGYTMTGNRIFSCNGVNWNDTTPSCYLDKKNIQKTCDFESDMCDWMNDFSDNFDWKIHSMATPSGSAGTGPEFDHSLGAGLNGKYLYIEASNRNAGDLARLVSPRYPPLEENSTNCFSFWYHMYGGHIGALNVYVGQDLAFSESGNHGNRWIKAVIPINHTSYPFYITIDGVRGNGYAGDIAIDDLKLSEGSDCDTQKNDTEVVLTGSCLGRCYENTSMVVNSCYCHDECHVNNSCCSDFSEICGLGNQASYYREKTHIITPSTIIGIILTTLTLGVIVCTVVFLIRRKKINRNGNGDDDSDVQFFRSDELINFNLARPSPDRQRSEPALKPQRPKKSVPQDCIRLVEQ